MLEMFDLREISAPIGHQAYPIRDSISLIFNLCIHLPVKSETDLFL